MTAPTKHNFQHHIVQFEASVFSFSVNYYGPSQARAAAPSDMPAAEPRLEAAAGTGLPRGFPPPSSNSPDFQTGKTPPKGGIDFFVC